ncbi:MAG: fused MFS/spermidine synthase, partial [Kiritimatiellae bacterium]|nr:fused MFS/spermidine synthase [Kiritimatiellia bacterium]
SAAAGLYLPFVMPTLTICLVCAAILAATGLGLLPFMNRRLISANAVPSSADFKTLSGIDLLHVFIVGFLAMAGELALARLVTPVLGGSHIVWSAVFITFIGWMGVGGAVGGKVADRFAGRVPAKALYIALGVAIYLTVLFETRVLGLWTMGFSAAMRLILYIFVGFAPFAFVLGFLSAFFMRNATAASLLAGDRASIGVTYAVGGIGSSCGSFFAGMVFVSSASVLASLPGAVRPLPAEISLDDDCRILYRGESSYNSVAVTGKASDSRLITIWLDRIPHTTVNLANPNTLLATYTRLLDAAIDVFAPPANRRVFMIGGGGYALPRKWRGETTRFSEVEVAEIDPLVSACAHRFMDAPADSSAFRDHIADGRRLADRFIAEGSTNRFDVVIGDTIGDAAIPYHLATQEFFEKVRDGLLAKDGIYLMHVLDVLDDPGLLSSIMKTLGSVFPNVVACSYSGVSDVRQSFVVAASTKPLDADAFAAEVRSRWPEALPITLHAQDVSALASSPSAILLTDSFAPVEKFVWRVMTRDVQYRSYAIAVEMEKMLAAGDRDTAFTLAKRVLAMQPEETRALNVIERMADDGNAEAAEILKREASRPSVREEAKVRYALYLGRQGCRDEAIAIWREVVRRWPNNHNYSATLKDLEK